jgi:hypothetical protein
MQVGGCAWVARHERSDVEAGRGRKKTERASAFGESRGVALRHRARAELDLPPLPT